MKKDKWEKRSRAFFTFNFTQWREGRMTHDPDLAYPDNWCVSFLFLSFSSITMECNEAWIELSQREQEEPHEPTWHSFFPLQSFHHQQAPPSNRSSRVIPSLVLCFNWKEHKRNGKRSAWFFSFKTKNTTHYDSLLPSFPSTHSPSILFSFLFSSLFIALKWNEKRNEKEWNGMVGKGEGRRSGTCCWIKWKGIGWTAKCSLVYSVHVFVPLNSCSSPLFNLN